MPADRIQSSPVTAPLYSPPLQPRYTAPLYSPATALLQPRCSPAIDVCSADEANTSPCSTPEPADAANLCPHSPPAAQNWCPHSPPAAQRVTTESQPYNENRILSRARSHTKCSLSPLPLLCHRHATVMPQRCHSDATAMPQPCHSHATTMPLTPGCCTFRQPSREDVPEQRGAAKVASRVRPPWPREWVPLPRIPDELLTRPRLLRCRGPLHLHRELRFRLGGPPHSIWGRAQRTAATLPQASRAAPPRLQHVLRAGALLAE